MNYKLITIRTPEHKHGKVYRWKIQTGIINLETMRFEPRNLIIGYPVQFHSLEDVEKSTIRKKNRIFRIIKISIKKLLRKFYERTSH